MTTMMMIMMMMTEFTIKITVTQSKKYAHVPPCQIHQWVLPSHLIPSQDWLLVGVLARA